jgi:hypothetical protein
MALVGPGVKTQHDINPDPLLQGSNEMEFVTIHNPLTDDFQVKVAQEVPVNMPSVVHNPTKMTQQPQDVVRTYGIDIQNPDFKSKKWIYNETIIPAGETRRFRGDMAQVALRQLVNEVMQREGNKRFMADPSARRLVEDRLVKGRGSVQDMMDGGLRSHKEMIDEAIDKSNEVKDETAFPGLKEDRNPNSGQEAEPINVKPGGKSSRRSVGRPKKTD